MKVERVFSVPITSVCPVLCSLLELLLCGLDGVLRQCIIAPRGQRLYQHPVPLGLRRAVLDLDILNRNIEQQRAIDRAL